MNHYSLSSQSQNHRPKQTKGLRCGASCRVDQCFRGEYYLHHQSNNEGSMHVLHVRSLQRDYAALCRRRLAPSCKFPSKFFIFGPCVSRSITTERKAGAYKILQRQSALVRIATFGIKFVNRVASFQKRKHYKKWKSTILLSETKTHVQRNKPQNCYKTANSSTRRTTNQNAMRSDSHTSPWFHCLTGRRCDLCLRFR
jgi:hypothetical protein